MIYGAMIFGLVYLDTVWNCSTV